MSVIRIQGESEKRRGIYYQLDSNDQPIGVGGMGQVFKGICVNEKTGHTRPVAIKFMFDDLPPHAIERARREASIQLRNDNLVEMLGFIEIAERTPLGDVKMHYHVVSELLTGVSLSDLMEGNTTDRDGNSSPFAERLLTDYKNDSEHFARTIVINILSGLMALHDAGYIHRDIDPSNIMVTTDGHIKLIDFGIAKQMKTLTTNDKGLTVAGKFMGKPEYAAPELVLGDIQHQNQTTDIYAMGILLYQCVVGHTPFEGARHEILEKQLKEKFPLDVIKNKDMRAIIVKACEKKQERRFQTSAEMRVALENPKSMTKSVSANPKTLVAAGIAAIVIALTTLAIWLLPHGEELTPEPQTIANVNTVTTNQQMTIMENKKADKPEDTPSTPPTSDVIGTNPKTTKMEDKKADKPEKNTSVPPASKSGSEASESNEGTSPKPATQINPTSGTINLGYATWKGGILNGKPNGKGTMSFTSSHRLDSRDPKLRVAEAGDRIEGTYIKGHLDYGRWFKSDGSSETIMLGE